MIEVPPRREAPVPGRPDGRPRVLIIEDDPASRLALTRLVKHNGGLCVAVSTVAEGLALLSMRPHRVLLDLMLPDGGGIAILEHVRRNDLPTKVGITTGTSDQDLLAAVRGLNPDAIFMKPLRFPDLEAWLTPA